MVLLLAPDRIWADTELNFSSREVTVLGDIPRIDQMPVLNAFTLYETDDFKAELFCVQDPKDKRAYWYYLFVYDPQHSRKTREVVMIYHDSDQGCRWWIDQEWFDGKAASRVLVQVKKKPDVNKAGQMHKNQWRYEI
jgi:hypothetical protein